MQVRVCSGKPTTIVASRIGFYPAGKHPLVSHTLVGLLQQISRVFDAVSSNSLMFHYCCCFKQFQNIFFFSRSNRL